MSKRDRIELGLPSSGEMTRNREQTLPAKREKGSEPDAGDSKPAASERRGSVTFGYSFRTEDVRKN